MKTTSIYILLLTGLLLLNACKKGEPLAEQSFASITVTSKPLVDVPSVLIYADDVLLDTLDGGATLTNLVPRGKSSIKLSVKDLATGALLLDSVFTPEVNNKFTILVDQALGIRQFFKPAASQVDDQHIRMQFYHRIVVNGVERRKVNFKFFARRGFTGPFTTTDYELKDVEFGKLSPAIDLPLLDPKGDLVYYMRTYDSQSGELLLDIFEDFQGGDIKYYTGGRSIIVNVRSDDYPPDGAYYNFLDAYEL